MTRCRERLLVALDGRDFGRLIAVAGVLADKVAGFKLGLSTIYDPRAADLLSAVKRCQTELFLDYKLYDIPSTVRHAAAAIAEHHPTFVTVHGAPAIVAAAKEVFAETTAVLAVTVLTSMTPEALQRERQLPPDASSRLKESMLRYIINRGVDAVRAGADGLITPVFALQPLRTALRQESLTALLVCPGITLDGNQKDDQMQTATVSQAIRYGADRLVAGRLLTAGDKPEAVLAQIERSL